MNFIHIILSYQDASRNGNREQITQVKEKLDEILNMNRIERYGTWEQIFEKFVSNDLFSLSNIMVIYHTFVFNSYREEFIVELNKYLQSNSAEEKVISFMNEIERKPIRGDLIRF